MTSTIKSQRLLMTFLVFLLVLSSPALALITPVPERVEVSNFPVDSSSGAIEVIDYEHHEIHSGSTYRVQSFNDGIASGGNLSIGFCVPDQPKLPHLMWEFVHEGDMTLYLFEDVSLGLGSGSDVLCKNSRRDAGDTSILQGVGTGGLVSNYVTKDPLSAGGSVISLKRDFGSKNVGSSSSRRAEVILRNDTCYLFTLINNEASPQGGQVRMEWYEHGDK